MEGGAYVRFRALWCRQRKTARHYFGSSEVRAVRLASRAGPIFRRARRQACGLVIECWSEYHMLVMLFL